MRFSLKQRLVSILLFGFLLFSFLSTVQAENRNFQETSRITAYAIAAEGEYIYILGDVINYDGGLPQGSLNLGGGMRDIFLAKLGSDGTLIYNAVIGGSGDDEAFSLGVREGVVYILGETWSRDFPGAPGSAGESDAVLLALAADGSQIQWARRFGGNDQDAGRSLAIQDESLYLAGITWSDDLIPDAGLGNADGFLARVRLDGALDWLEVFGGNALDAPFDLALSGDNLWVVGQSYSRDFGGSHQGEGDVFLAQFSLDGEAEFAALYGGREADIAYALSLDENGNIFLAGGTRTDDLPDAVGEFGGNYDGFIMEIDQEGILQKSIYMGGTGIDYAHDIEILANDELLVVGETYSPSFPMGYDAVEDTFGEGDAFILQFDSEGQVVRNLLKGGEESDRARAMALTENGLWLAGRFTVGTLTYGLLVPANELGQITFPTTVPDIPTATLGPTATPQPTETLVPTSTVTPLPTSPQTVTATAENTAPVAGSDQTSTPTEIVNETGEAADPTQTFEMDVDGPFSVVSTGTVAAEDLGAEESSTGAGVTEPIGGISTGLLVGIGLLLVAAGGGAYFWYRRNKRKDV